MPCNCGRSRSRSAASRSVVQPSQSARGESRGADWVQVRYNGPLGSHLVPSPLRRVNTYGLHTRGDVFAVDPTDQAHLPTVFVLVEGE